MPFYLDQCAAGDGVNDTVLRFGAAELAVLASCPETIAADGLARLKAPELRYRPLDTDQAGKVIADIRHTLTHSKLRTVGDDDPSAWEKGWAELVARLGEHPITTDTLRPQYFHAEVPCRLQHRLVAPASADFEYWVGLGLRWLIFRQFLLGQHRVVEFGCGTGINLLLLAGLLPEARLVGCDWARPSQDLIARLAQQTGRAIGAHRINMLHSPWTDLAIDQGAAVLTVHALEQLGSQWGPFLDNLRQSRPGLCVHIEPLLELYNPDDSLDALSRGYHLKRNYLRGFVPAVQQLAAEGRAEILTLRRTPFSGLYHEAYSVLVWRPR